MVPDASVMVLLEAETAEVAGALDRTPIAAAEAKPSEPLSARTPPVKVLAPESTQTPWSALKTRSASAPEFARTEEMVLRSVLTPRSSSMRSLLEPKAVSVVVALALMTFVRVNGPEPLASIRREPVVPAI